MYGNLSGNYWEDNEENTILLSLNRYNHKDSHLRCHETSISHVYVANSYSKQLVLLVAQAEFLSGKVRTD